jgi:hydroxyethylthiazole kinase-like uncharacterized protein yjeF
MPSYRVMPRTDHLPYALYSARQVRAFDRMAIGQFGIPGEALMERAGAATFALMRERWPNARDITVLAGTGNNGGDGFVLARLAAQAGLSVHVLQLGDRDKIRGDARLNVDRFSGMPGDWLDYRALPAQTDVIVDALLGTGLERELAGVWAQAAQDVNAHSAPVLAVDIPSGLHSDTGVAMGNCVRASASISFIGLKQGMFTAAGPEYCGELFFDALEIPARVYASEVLSARRVDWVRLSDQLEPRSRIAHKGHFGHVLVVGGDLGYGGAVRLCAEAALRTGAGLVSLATRPQHVAAVLAARPEIMVRGIEQPNQLEDLVRQASVVAVGPGLGQGAWGKALWEQLRQCGRPMVVDADALNLLATTAGQMRDDWILTPHPGEAARLLDECDRQIYDDRFDAASRIQRRFGGIAVLKGAGTVIHGQGQIPPAVCSDGNPGMASGGMGDVLTGVIAGFLAQGYQPQQAAEMGVCLHAAAADRVAIEQGERGMLATDLMCYIQRLVNP